ncbi:MAG: nucleoside deaminase, partial [Pseudomonadota bacterium]
MALSVTMSHMETALIEARLAAERGEVPVGAVLVLQGGEPTIASGNRMRELADPTAHAELLVIRQACKERGSDRLPDCDLYVTLEPCTMCAAAISFARIRRLYFGATDPKMGAVESGVRFFSQASCHHRPEVYGGIAAKEAASLMQSFFAT